MRDKASLREQQKRDRRRRIFEEALRLFRDRGFQETTVVDIAKAARVSRGTVFNYYPYKEAILLQHAAGRLGRLARQVEQELERCASAIDTLYLVFDDLAVFAEEERDLFLPLSYELLNPDPGRSRAAFEALPLARIVAMILSRGREQGVVREDFSRERLARTIANTYFLTALQWAAYRSDRSVRAELHKALKLTLEGIKTGTKAPPATSTSG